MPIHDWTIVQAGTFHYFHQRWIQAIGDALNTGGLPDGYFAMTEVEAKGPIPDVLALKAQPPGEPTQSGGLALLDAPPRTRVVSRGSDVERYARRADRISVRMSQGELVAVIEIVSPGNKSSKIAFKTFVRKAGKLLRRGVHLLIIDLFPPTPRDPVGLHKPIWDQFKEEPFILPPDKQLTLAAYSADYEKVAYVENLAVGDALIDMPLFLEPDRYVHCPLEATYQTSWNVFPSALKGPLEMPAIRS